MDLHEWEILPDVELLDSQDDEKIIYGNRSSACDAKINLNMNYFLCPQPSLDSRQISRPARASRMPEQPIPITLQLDSPIVKVPDEDGVVARERIEIPVEISVVPSVMRAKDHIGAVEADQDRVTQVFFKKLENEFVDMKIDSPRSSNKVTKPQIDVGNFQFVGEGEAEEHISSSPRLSLTGEESNMEIVAKGGMNWDRSSGGLNILKWSLNGIGAICSFGVAAVTICILFHGGHHQSTKPHQKLRFQIYTNDKKLNQVVQQATRLNEAISASAVRGVPLTRAHITCGGYYDGR